MISYKRERLKFRIDNGQLGGIVAEDTDNNERTRVNELANAEVLYLNAVPINEVLEKHNAPRIIDYFSLDVEGSEERVITTLDFSQYQFQCITVERPTPKVNEVLFDHHYKFVKNHNYDSFYIHPSVVLQSNVEIEKFSQIPAKNW